MTRLSLALAAALAMTTPTLAQDTPPPQGEGERGRRERGQGGERGQGRGGFGGGMGGMGLPLEQLQRELGLTPEQVKEVEAINQELREKGRTLMREAFQSGNPGAVREQIQKMFEEGFERLEGTLDAEQKEKVKAVRAQMAERMQNMQGRMREGGAARGRGGEGGPMGRGNTRQRLKDEALRALALTDEELAVVGPLLDTCLETRELLMAEGETRRQSFLQKARETTDAEALGKLLDQFRVSREQDKATVKQAMDQLREVLTVEQEAKLVGLGVLD
ncbi:MAG: hypothetical protein M9894_28610 [Planctomycetes bacterium]|nr:hypothetical protein [Planctomycetota bacterium]